LLDDKIEVSNKKNQETRLQIMRDILDRVLVFAAGGSLSGYVFDSILAGIIGLFVFACLGLLIGLREQRNISTND